MPLVTFVNVVPIQCSARVLCVAPFAEAMDEIRANMAALKAFDPDGSVTVEAGAVRPLFEASEGWGPYAPLGSVKRETWSTRTTNTALMDPNLRWGSCGVEPGRCGHFQCVG